MAKLESELEIGCNMAEEGKLGQPDNGKKGGVSGERVEDSSYCRRDCLNNQLNEESNSLPSSSSLPVNSSKPHPN